MLNNKKFPELRQGDQSHINRAWILMNPDLRFIFLPEEYYCYWDNGEKTWKVKMSYECKSVHGHYTDKVIERNSKLKL